MAGGGLVFQGCEVFVRDNAEIAAAPAALAELSGWAAWQGQAVERGVSELLQRLAAPRPRFAGLALDRPLLMGVVNVTPDSFSDGGDHFDAKAAIAHGEALVQAGADIVDIGGESTRPGSAPVPEEEELRRVLPVVRALAGAGATVSIDSRRARVMTAAIEAGATIINDVTALSGDEGSLRAAAENEAGVVLMHMQGEPRTMQAAPSYAFAPLDVYDFLEGRVEACRGAGIDPSRIAVDPGIGFGKTLEHNLELLRHLALLHGLGCAIVLGVSRKTFIGLISGEERPRARLPGSLAAALWALDQGVQILRVHDVAETAQAVAVWSALRGLS